MCDQYLEDEDDDVASPIMANYNLAEFIRDRLVPRAVLFYTGEAVDEESDAEDGSVGVACCAGMIRLG